MACVCVCVCFRVTTNVFVVQYSKQPFLRGVCRGREEKTFEKIKKNRHFERRAKPRCITGEHVTR